MKPIAIVLIMMQVCYALVVWVTHCICVYTAGCQGCHGHHCWLEWPQGHRTEGQQPCGLHILNDEQHDDCRVGRMARNSAERLPTTVCQVTATFKIRNGRFEFERHQYPIVLAWAVTIHKLHGLSLDKAVI